MGFLARIKRHAAVARGNFASMFKEVEIPPLPTALTRLIGEINEPEPDIARLEKLITAETGIASKLIRTVNSPLSGLRRPATNVRHAVSLLGFRQVKSIVMAYAAMEGLPSPPGDLFDHEAFWVDSLVKAMFARSFAKVRHMGHLEDVFTATLLNDIALPVLLTAWSEYYAPVMEAWRESDSRLSEIERAQFGWDHAQAGGWIAHSWGLPEEIACYIGAHNIPWEKMEEFELTETLAAPSWVAAFFPSVLKPDPQRIRRVTETAQRRLLLDRKTLQSCLREVRGDLVEIMALLDLPELKAAPLLDLFEEFLRPEDPQ